MDEEELKGGCFELFTAARNSINLISSKWNNKDAQDKLENNILTFGKQIFLDVYR